MIEIDVSVPVLDEHFDVRTDENNTADTFLEELLELLVRKTGGAAAGPDGQRYTLFSARKEERLKGGLTLYAQGIRDGSRLILV